jgi:hypothetical protein
MTTETILACVEFSWVIANASVQKKTYSEFLTKDFESNWKFGIWLIHAASMDHGVQLVAQHR